MRYSPSSDTMRELPPPCARRAPYKATRNAELWKQRQNRSPYDHCVLGLSCSSPSTSRSTFSLKNAKSPSILAASGIGSG
jgi:hypothetical protein